MWVLRSHLKPSAWLALIALVSQLVLSFGHTHDHFLSPGRDVPGQASLSQLSWPSQPGPDNPGASEAFCTICATISLAASVILPVALAALLTLFAGETGWRADRAIALFANPTRDHYRARAPPF